MEKLVGQLTISRTIEHTKQRKKKFLAIDKNNFHRA